MTAELVVMRGLPASGKTTAARPLVEQGYVRISHEELRAMAFPRLRFTRERDEIIKGLQFHLVHILLSMGHSVVVDDLNLTDADVLRWERCAAITNSDVGYIVCATPIDVCVRRDAGRADKSVGEDEILELAREADWLYD